MTDFYGSTPGLKSSIWYLQKADYAVIFGDGCEPSIIIFPPHEIVRCKQTAMAAEGSNSVGFAGNAPGATAADGLILKHPVSQVEKYV